MRSEHDILAEIRRLRHRLDRQRLTRTLAELKTLRAQLPKESVVESSTTAGDAQRSA